MKTFSNDDILYKLMNTTLNTFSDNELVRRAIEEIRNLREQIEVLGRRNNELCTKVEELLKEKLNGQWK